MSLRNAEQLLRRIPKLVRYSFYQSMGLRNWGFEKKGFLCWVLKMWGFENTVVLVIAAHQLKEPSKGIPKIVRYSHSQSRD